MEQNRAVAPVLKWVGGKRQLLPFIEKRIPVFSTYYEPFMGGGAVLFHLQPKSAVVNDVNAELINLYTIIKERVEELIEDLMCHENNEDYFYKIRELDRDARSYQLLDPLKKASRMIYLNKTCYNGLFRVNKLGAFNSPFGSYKNPNIVNERTLRAVSEYFNVSDVSFFCEDFETVVSKATKGSFVYFDPPYDPVSHTANFTGYDKGGFNKNEQIRLREVCAKLDEQGVKFLLSNSATTFIKDLYHDFHVELIPARRAINSDPKKRSEVDELLVRNYHE